MGNAAEPSVARRCFAEGARRAGTVRGFTANLLSNPLAAQIFDSVPAEIVAP